MTAPHPDIAAVLDGRSRWCVAPGDNRPTLAALADGSLDACVTDAPYELGFMGKTWDASGIAFDVEFWRAVLRVLKPGGHLLAFGGTRTYHRMACAIEDAGFEIRDSLHWIYGTGFPKSMDVSKAMDAAERGRFTARKIAFFMAARGMSASDLAQKSGLASPSSILDWTVGGHVPSESNWKLIKVALGVTADEEARFEREVVARGQAGLGQGTWCEMGAGFKAEFDVTAAATDLARRWEGWGTALKPGHEPIVLARKPLAGTVAANVERYGTGRAQHRRVSDRG
jgi:hypothetical protein